MVTIGLVGAGAMGSALGANWQAGGARVVTCVAGRSARTRELVSQAGIGTVESLEEVTEADIVASVVPPSDAIEVAKAVVAVANRTTYRTLVLDLNAVAPTTVDGIQAVLKAAGLDLVDGSISGPPPRPGDSAARVYLSGSRASEITALASPWADVIELPGPAGRASALKMCTASMYKGTNALIMQALLTARAHGVVVTVTAVGGTSNGVTYTYLAAPPLVSVTPDFGPVAGGNTVTLTGSGFTGASAVTFGSTAAGSFTVVSDNEITAVVPAGAAGPVTTTVTTPGGVSNGVIYTYVAAPTLTALTPSAGPDAGGNAVVLTGTGFSGATAVTFGGTPALSFIVNSDAQITATAPAGTGTVQVVATTPSGTTAGLPYTYLPAPALISVAPDQGPQTGGNTVVLTGTNLTGTTAVNFGATAAVSFTVDSDTQITAIAPADTGTVQVTATTAGGTSNGVSYSYVPAPTLASIAPDQGPATGGNTVTLTGTGFTGASQVLFRTTPATSFTVVSDTQITAVVPAQAPGPVSAKVVTTGGTSNGVIYTYIAAPVLATITPTSGPETGTTTVVLTGTGLTGTTAVLFGATPATSFTVDSDTQITATAPAGTGAVQVTATTVGGTSNGLSYTYVPVPVLTSLAPTQGPSSGGNTVVLTGTHLTGTTAVNFGATTAVSFTVDSDTQITAIAPADTGTVQVTATTTGGTSNGVSYTYVPAPVLTSVAPNQGPTSGGNTVTLTGTGFTGASQVRFRTTPATSFTVVSDTQITAVAPAQPAGPVSVKVVTTGGTSNGVIYTYIATPVLSTITPNSGPVAGVTTVVLTGTGLTGTTAVRFGATPATSFTVNSDTQITATAPAGTGTVQVTATTVGGTSNGLAYTYVAVPVLTSVTPNRGPISAGNTVTLTGTRLTGATTVRFGAIAAVSFMVVSDTQITAVAPAGTGTVQVTATTIGGTSNGVSYTYVAAPTLTSITPNQGLAAGGNTVTLTGTGFTGATAVTFRTTPATSFTVVSDTQITAVVPGQAPASVAVTVTTPGGTSNGVIYIYLAAPTLASLSPNQGSVSGGKNVNIVGTGFTGATAVTFGSTPAASFTVISDTQIKAVTPPGNGTVQVTVTGPGGTSNARPYTYLQTPALSSISPTSGPAAGGTVVIISGDRLSTATEVDFGTRTATSFTVNSNTQITAVAPAGTGTVQVTVITLGGTSNGISYTYV